MGAVSQHDPRQRLAEAAGALRRRSAGQDEEDLTKSAALAPKIARLVECVVTEVCFEMPNAPGLLMNVRGLAIYWASLATRARQGFLIFKDANPKILAGYRNTPYPQDVGCEGTGVHRCLPNIDNVL